MASHMLFSFAAMLLAARCAHGSVLRANVLDADADPLQAATGTSPPRPRAGNQEKETIAQQLWPEAAAAHSLGASAGRTSRAGRLAQFSPVMVMGCMAAFRARSPMPTGAAWRTDTDTDFRWWMELSVALFLFATVGPAVILLNKHIMKHFHFHFPTLLASMGMLFLMVATRAADVFGVRSPERETMDWRKYLRVVVPISVFNFAAQVLGMYPYMFISVPHIQIMKSLTIVWTLGFAWLLASERVNGQLVASILFIVTGCVVSSAGASGEAMTVHETARAATIGTLLTISCGMFEGLKTVYSQIMMVNLPLFDGIYWASPCFVALAAVFGGCTELHGLISFEWSWPLVLALLANTLLTSAIVISTFWFVKLAGAVTAKVVVQVRSVGTVLVAVLFCGEVCSTQQYYGYSVTLVGVGLFDFAKQRLQKPMQPGKNAEAKS